MSRTQRHPRRRLRSIVAATSGLAIGIAGIGAAALPAAADPTGEVHRPRRPAPRSRRRRRLAHRHPDHRRPRDASPTSPTARTPSTSRPPCPAPACRPSRSTATCTCCRSRAMPYLAAGVARPRPLQRLAAHRVRLRRRVGRAPRRSSSSRTDGRAPRSARPLPGLEVQARARRASAARPRPLDHATRPSTWSALTAASGALDFSARTPSLAGGIEAIHLDGKVQATLDSSVPCIDAPAAWAAGLHRRAASPSPCSTPATTTPTPTSPGRVLADDSKSFVPGEEVASDPHGHGTHVASTIAGTGAASGGTHRGVADGADLLVGKVLGADGSGQDSWIIEAMEWAGRARRIVSMSLGSSEPSDGKDLMSESLNTISEETGALFVVAAGNNGAPEAIGAPGAAAEALTVGSVADPIGRPLVLLQPGPARVLGRAEARARRPRQRRHRRPLGRQPRRGLVHRDERHLDGDAARRRRRRDLLKQQHPEYTADAAAGRARSTAKDVGLTLVRGRLRRRRPRDRDRRARHRVGLRRLRHARVGRGADARRAHDRVHEPQAPTRSSSRPAHAVARRRARRRARRDGRRAAHDPGRRDALGRR